MPYIPAERRFEATENPQTSGELNFAITRLIDDYVLRHPRGLCYDTINEVRGALLCASDEFYRRVAVPYEDGKRQQNGDVYLCNQEFSCS